MADCAQVGGLFVTFEGVDGVGKTTQITRLATWLESRGRQVVLTREPGGTGLGTSLRKLILHGDDMSARTEALLYAADRAQHVAEVIRPALQAGKVVISDRYLDSSIAYQAGGRELTEDEVRGLSMWATGGLMPERTYLLDMDPEVAIARLTHEPDRLESAGSSFRARTRSEFLRIAQSDPVRWRVLDAAADADAISSEISADVCALL